MQNNPLISVIIPAYNVEKYINRCIESIIYQDYKNIEVIIINDGSTDNTREICEQYIKQDKRIRLINTENRGAGSARNTGIENANGKYFSFIDADDFICEHYYSRLYEMIKNTKADIAEGH